VRNPLLFLLLFAAGVSVLTGEWADAAIVLAIVAASVAIGYRRERDAQAAAAALRARVRTRARVIRDGRAEAIPHEAVVPGDVVLLSAGSLVPADGILLDATDCHLSEAVLTGESFPVEKRPGAVAAETPLARRTNCVFLASASRFARPTPSSTAASSASATS
jgi:Mg2+-importing ATPase